MATASPSPRGGQARTPETASLEESPLASIWARPLPSGAAAHLEALAARVRSGRATYVSTPITTGPRLLAWRRANPDHAERDPFGTEVRREVIAENIRALSPLRAKIARSNAPEPVIDPTELDEGGWAQPDYHRFWLEVIDRFASTVVLADGWQYSTGCAYEFAFALCNNLRLLDADLEPVNLDHAQDLLDRAARELELAGLSTDGARAALRVIGDREAFAVEAARGAGSLKDDVLAHLASLHNVALFASFTPGPAPVLRHFCSRGSEVPDGMENILERLLAESHEGALNVRTFKESESKSSPFIYGLRSVADVAREVRRLAGEGYYTIVNETIDIHDGGVSGVRLGGVVEFAPDTTPRGVENSDVARMPVTLANQLLSAVYGTPIDLPGSGQERIEFSIHPDSVGHRGSHVCVWESEPAPNLEIDSAPEWPNDFSRILGDKAFGLLVAHLSGARVPYATVVSRRVAPFSFGERTSTGEWWIRTAPRQQEPGLFSTRRGWTDPFRLLATEDPEGVRIASVLSQEGVRAEYSGATLPGDGGADLIEGVRGSGDRFMLGLQTPDVLPDRVHAAVRSALRVLAPALGRVRIEWAFDGETAWVLQVHRLPDGVFGTLNPGAAARWEDYDPARGLEVLRDLVSRVKGTDTGVLVTGRVGITSHVGDLLRAAGVPARFAHPPT